MCGCCSRGRSRGHGDSLALDPLPRIGKQFSVALQILENHKPFLLTPLRLGLKARVSGFKLRDSLAESALALRGILVEEFSLFGGDRVQPLDPLKKSITQPIEDLPEFG